MDRVLIELSIILFSISDLAMLALVGRTTGLPLVFTYHSTEVAEILGGSRIRRKSCVGLLIFFWLSAVI